jgi:hypothetical protein
MSLYLFQVKYFEIYRSFIYVFVCASVCVHREWITFKIHWTSESRFHLDSSPLQNTQKLFSLLWDHGRMDSKAFLYEGSIHKKFQKEVLEFGKSDKSLTLSILLNIHQRVSSSQMLVQGPVTSKLPRL